MRRYATLVALIAATFVLGACGHGGRHQRHQAMSGAPAAGAAIYWCACGADCACNTVLTKPGKCPCGKEMAGGHVIFTEGNTALVCPCGPDCVCALDPKDRSKCGCGQPVKKINLQGTGLYFCNCGGSCGCNTVSDQAGPCRCGMQLHQAQ